MMIYPVHARVSADFLLHTKKSPSQAEQQREDEILSPSTDGAGLRI